MPHKIELTLAYGRTVSSMQDLVGAWESGMDFKICGGPYCSIRDLPYLKQEYDCIIIHALDKNRKCIFSYNVFSHILMGVTNYI